MQFLSRQLVGILLGTLLIGVGLAGCSTLTRAPAAPAAPPAADQPSPVVVSTWSADSLYDLLVGEIAGQRAQPDAALAAYLRQARALRDPALAARATRIAWYVRQPDKIRAAASLWAELAPEDPEANTNAVLGLIQGGEIEAAAPLLDRLLSSAGQPVRFNFVVQYAQESDPVIRARIGALLANLSVTHPENTRLWFARAALADINGDPIGALALAQRARALNPDHPATLELEGRLLAATGASTAARKLLRNATRKFPRERDLRLAYLRTLLEANRGRDAKRELENMLLIWPEDGDLVMSLALLEWETGHPDSARQRFVALAESGYREDEAWFYAGRIAVAQQRHGDAAGYFQNVRGPQFLQAQVQVAYAWQKTGRLADARALIAALRQQAPESAPQLYVAESELLWRADAGAEAFAVIDRALAVNPTDNDLRYARAMTAERLGRIEVTEADLRTILAVQPNNAMVLNALGYTLADRTDRTDEARTLIERALALSPDDPAIVDSMGWVLFRQGKTAEAIGWLQRALSLVPDAEIAAHLGEALWANGQHRAARQIWQRARALDPENNTLRQTIRRLDQ